MPKNITPAQRFIQWFEKQATKEKFTKTNAQNFIDKMIKDMNAFDYTTGYEGETTKAVKKRVSIYLQRLTRGETALCQIQHRMIELQVKAEDSKSSDRTQSESLSKIIAYMQLLSAYEFARFQWSSFNTHSTILANRKAYNGLKPYARILLAYGLLEYLKARRRFPERRRDLRNFTYTLVREHNLYEKIEHEFNVTPNKEGMVNVDEVMSEFIEDLDLGRVIKRNLPSSPKTYKTSKKRSAKKNTSQTTAKSPRKKQTMKPKRRL